MLRESHSSNMTQNEDVAVIFYYLRKSYNLNQQHNMK